jgi:hypothetical protein
MYYTISGCESRTMNMGCRMGRIATIRPDIYIGLVVNLFSLVSINCLRNFDSQRQ